MVRQTILALAMTSERETYHVKLNCTVTTSCQGTQGAFLLTVRNPSSVHRNVGEFLQCVVHPERIGSGLTRQVFQVIQGGDARIVVLQHRG